MLSCDVAEIENSECDAECNTLQHGFDGGSCCLSSGAGCLPWHCRDRTDTSVFGTTCAETKPFCHTTGTNWFSPEMQNRDACPVTCGTCHRMSSNENIWASWPYAWVIGSDDAKDSGEKVVVSTMPASFHQALREQQMAELEAQESRSQNRSELHDKLLSLLPSFACPECRSYPETEPYRSIPFTVPGEPPQMFKQLSEDKPRMRCTLIFF